MTLSHLTAPNTPLAIIGLGYVGLPLAVEFGKHRLRTTQRDLNIALMNELALIFGKLGIDTLERPPSWAPNAPTTPSSSPSPIGTSSHWGPPPSAPWARKSASSTTSRPPCRRIRWMVGSEMTLQGRSPTHRE